MEDNRFIDMYFESEAILLKIDYSEKKNMTTFMTYLENLHSVGDKLRDKFDCKINNIAEFIILRIVRNYFHHVDDIKEYSIFVDVGNKGIYEHDRHLIISMKDFAKAIKDFRDNNKNEYVEKQFKIINKFIDYELLDKVDVLSNLPKFTVDNNNEVLESGIDLFKYVYNISNIIADKCRNIETLKNKEVIKNLEETYTEFYNIPKRDFRCHPNDIPILTTKGFYFPENIYSIKKVD